eukprot:CAMPEP_0172516804 /NCGR_PEP_ID=MMETSP1066-20121228/279253_1 /TAXON_ID=671091 /ORGANISM="Coscinodiscus wailesii, Strain CCMP2513" /LENGTH=146 /DNA_ID=CAMNT_0013298443 /DNA_START=25 /DNA_END=462 /DNA_ORIENTATION=-
MSATPSKLNVLICSGNIGNTEPTPNDIAAWLPKDGSIESVIKNGDYPLESAKAKKGRFDIIVIGMQEATFLNVKKKDNVQAKKDRVEINDDHDNNQNKFELALCEPNEFANMMDYMNWALEKRSEMAKYTNTIQRRNSEPVEQNSP